jgi:hypothetical protein
MLKKIFYVAFDIFLLIIIAGWTYLLYREFLSLPDNSELLRFSLFQIKLILFTLFLISSVTFLWFTTSSQKKKALSIDNPHLKDLEENLKRIAFLLGEKKEEDLLSEISTSYFSEVEKLVNVKSIEELFNDFIRISKKITKARRISIEFYDFSKQKLTPIKTIGFKLDDKFVNLSSNPPSKIVFESGKKLFVTNIETHPLLARKNNPAYLRKSFMIFPVKMFGINFGVINFSEKNSEDGIFTSQEFEAVSILVSMFSLKIENILLYFSLEDLLEK